MTSKKKCRFAVMTFGPPQAEPWWGRHIDLNALGAEMTWVRLSLGRKYATQVGLLELPVVLLKVARALFAIRKKVDYVFTFECDLTSFAIALLQTLRFARGPRHVIVQFIMREKTPRLSSRAKYLFMRFCFSSVYRVVCSSRREAAYYREVFGWGEDKVRFAPYHTHPSLVRETPPPEEHFIIAAGRTFRDYPTFIEAVADLPVRVVIVAGRGTLDPSTLPSNVELRFDIPPDELNALLERSRLVVLPLENRKISTGQSVLLQAMSLGKVVVATNTAGTEDYIRDGFDGALVPPNDPRSMRSAIQKLLADAPLRAKIAANAIRAIRVRHLPQHYITFVASALEPRG